MTCRPLYGNENFELWLADGCVLHQKWYATDYCKLRVYDNCTLHGNTSYETYASRKPTPLCSTSFTLGDYILELNTRLMPSVVVTVMLVVEEFGHS